MLYRQALNIARLEACCPRLRVTGLHLGWSSFRQTSSHHGDCCLRGGPLPILGLLLLLGLTHGRKQVCGQSIQPVEVWEIVLPVESSCSNVGSRSASEWWAQALVCYQTPQSWRR